HLGISKDYSSLKPQERRRVLSDLLDTPVELSRNGWSEKTQRVIELFGVLEEFNSRAQGEGLGAHIVSMTRSSADILALLWLQKTFAPSLNQALVPLLETVDDLNNGPQILRELFANKVYSNHF